MNSITVMLCYLIYASCTLSIDSYVCEHSWTNLGRVDYGNMCDQQRMELLIQGFNNVEYFLDEEKEFKDACEWQEVTCDDEQNVVRVEWHNFIIDFI